MKVLKIEIKGVNGVAAMTLLNAISEAKDRCANFNSIDISYRYEEDNPVPEQIPATESTPFSRYLQSTTPEGRS